MLCSRLIVLWCIRLATSGALFAECIEVCVAQEPPLPPADVEFFEAKIRPALTQHCLACHNVEKRKGGLALDHRAGWQQGGDSGPALVPGKADESLLLSALEYESFEMPPKGKLPVEVINNFRQWIARGAVDPRDEIPAATRPPDDDWESALADRMKWWSIQPVGKVAPPPVADTAWPKNEVDHFVLHALEAKQLSPAPSADRRTLARRLSFALTGLPPTPDEVERFAADESTDAYEQLVDRLLASPHFGERWARHWMDVMHYADTHGYEWDIPAKNAWIYRDYLIRAFNQDVPYRQLVLEHLAGDLLDPPRLGPEGINESIIGPMALRMGERRHGDNGTAFGKGVLEEAIDNTIDTVSKGFLGTTVACSQCHHHKLDAVPQHDYYALAGMLTSSRWVVRSIEVKNPNGDTIAELRRLKEQIHQELGRLWQASVEQLPARLQALATTAVAADAPLPETPQALWNALRQANDSTALANRWSELRRQWLTLREQRMRHNRQLTLVADFTQEAIPAGWRIEGFGMESGLVTSGELAIADEGPSAVRHLLPAGRWTHAWSMRLPGVVRSPLLDQSAWDAVAVGCWGGSQASWGMILDHALFPEGANAGFFNQPTFGWITQPTKVNGCRSYFELATKSFNNNYPPRAGLAPGGEHDPRSWVGITRVYAHAAPQDELSRYEELLAKEAGPTSVEGVAAELAGWVRRTIDRWQQRAATDEDVQTLNALLVAGLLPKEASSSPPLQQLVEQYRQAEARLRPDRTVGSLADFDEARDERLRIRGSYTELAEATPRGNIRLLEPNRSPLAHHQSGRLEVAQNWVDPHNPLLARVMVNRIWNYLFGQGLVRSLDDFGHLGEQPSHPELLDWLANRYAADGYSTKRLIRLLLTSATWRQSGQTNTVCLEVDPDNSLWHHMPPRRLEAEAIRDALLATSDRLDATMFGPPIEPYRTAEDKEKRLFIGPLDGNGRRSIYLRMTLMEPPRFLALFNQPMPKQTVGHRDVTNVPDQALAMLNDPLVIALAQHWAGQVATEQASVDQRLRKMFHKAIGRPPEPVELDWLMEFTRESARCHQVAEVDISTAAAVWRDVAHALFNLKEFIYVP